MKNLRKQPGEVVIERQTKSLAQYIEALYSQSVSVKEGILEMARTYVEMIDIYGIDGRDEFQKYFESRGEPKSIQFCNRLEDCGRGRLRWELLPEISTVSNATQLRLLPISDQTAIFEKNRKYPLLLPDGDHKMVDVTNLSRIQAKQMFDGGCIRDLAAQKTWLIENSPPIEQTDEIKAPWVLSSGAINILPHERTLRLTKAQLREILLQI